jgi:twitching motility two-component system response regulator PilH
VQHGLRLENPAIIKRRSPRFRCLGDHFRDCDLPLGKGIGQFFNILDKNLSDRCLQIVDSVLDKGVWHGSGTGFMSVVLIVDDSTMVREMISFHLKGSGFQVTEAVDGLHGMEQVQNNRPDIVITDIVMPRMNGYEFCRWIKSNPSTQTIPVIMCTTKGEEFDRYWGMKQGADAYITKPYLPNDMVNAINQLLGLP